MRDNCFVTLKGACEAANERLGENQLLDDGAENWDIENLMAAAADSEELDGKDNYYCVGHDGSIGITNDNGYNVNWVYKAV